MRNTFYGWDMKCQSDLQTLAVIPAVHQSGLDRDVLQYSKLVAECRKHVYNQL